MLILQAQPAGMDGSMTIIMVVGFLVLMYFTSIRPNQKRNKEAKAFQESIGKGSKIVTEGGLHGTIVKLEESFIIIEVESGARMKVERDQISTERTALRYKS